MSVWLRKKIQTLLRSHQWTSIRKPSHDRSFATARIAIHGRPLRVTVSRALRVVAFALTPVGDWRCCAPEDNFSGELVDNEQVHRTLQRLRLQIGSLRFGKQLGRIRTAWPTRQSLARFKRKLYPSLFTFRKSDEQGSALCATDLESSKPMASPVLSRVKSP